MQEAVDVAEVVVVLEMLLIVDELVELWTVDEVLKELELLVVEPPQAAPWVHTPWPLLVGISPCVHHFAVQV